MNRQLCLAVTVTLLWATPSYGVLIDSFQTAQSLTVSSSFEIAESQVFGSGIIGGARGTALQSIGSNGASLNVGGGHFLFTSGAETVGQTTVVWDGPANTSPLAPDITGLGNVDLTAGGTLNALAITVSSTNQPIEILMRLYESGNRDDGATFSVPGGVASPQTFAIPFSEFEIGNSNGFRANYSKINAITLFVTQQTPNINLQLDSIETVFVPEPSSIVLASLGMFTFLVVRRRW